MSTIWRRALRLVAVLSLAVAHSASRCDAEAGVLEKVRGRAKVICGVAEGSANSPADSEAVWGGISADYCRALAVAVLGNKDAVELRAVAKGEVVAVLQAGQVDVVLGNIAMTWNHDTAPGVRFPGALVFSGQGFMVRKAQAVASALELSGTRICVGVGADAADAQGIADYFGALRMPYELSKFEKWPDAIMAYGNKGCQVLSGDMFALALTRQQLADPAEHLILPELAARRPMGPAIAQGDEAWFSIVRWTTFALIAAEEHGVSSANVDAMKSSTSAGTRRLLGIEGDGGARLGLEADWAQRMIRQVGNYGELFERHLGPKSPLKLERRLNNLAGNGGLLYAPPFR